MKRVIVLLVIALIVPTGTDAHNTVKKASDLTSDYYEVNKVFKNSFYFTFASTYAMNGFEKNMGMSSGLGLNIGHIFYLHSINVSDQFHFGMDVTFLSWSFCLAKDNYANDIGINATHFFASKIGPIVSFNPVDRLVIDTKFTFQPTCVTYDYYFTGKGYKFRKGFGLSLRYKPFTLGVDYSWGNTMINLREDNAAYGEFSEISTNRLDVVFGFSF